MTEEKKMARLLAQQSYTTDDWLEWLYKVCNGKLVREESIKERCPKQYEMIMNLFYDWNYVVDAFHERFKTATKPSVVLRSMLGRKRRNHQLLLRLWLNCKKRSLA